MSELLYLYGFVPAASPTPPADLPGQDGGAVEVLDCGEETFRAVVSRVPAATWDAPSLDARLRDLGWVAERGLEHEGVVAWFVDNGGIIPVPLFTLYTGPSALQSAAAARAAELAHQLERFAGLREWDLKVGYDASTLTRHAGALSDEVRAFDAELAAAPPGRRYLLEKKRAVMVAELLTEVARREATALLDRLEGSAREIRTLPLPRAGRDLPVVLHAAVLLEVAEESAATRTVAGRGEELGRLGISVDWSGPWAPYRFLAGEGG